MLRRCYAEHIKFYADKLPGHGDEYVFGSRSYKVLRTPAWVDESRESNIYVDRSQETSSEHHVCSVVSSFTPGGDQAPVPQDEHTVDPDIGCTWGNHACMDASTLEKLKQVVRERKHVFAYSMKDLPGYTGDFPPFRIEMTTNEPIYEKPRRLSPAEQEVQDKKCQELLDAGIIEICDVTDYASNPVLPVKKDPVTGEYTDRRLAIDFRNVNLYSQSDRANLHDIAQIFQDLGHSNSRFFTAIDCRGGFHNLWIYEPHRKYTAFWWI